MAANASISGLASGLDTATIISQLMQLEAVPRTRLQTQVTNQESAVKGLQDINGKIAALMTKAEALAQPTGWSPVTSTSSYDKVGITTSTGAAAASLSFTVGETARAHTLTFGTAAALNAVVTGGDTRVNVDLLDGNGPVALDTNDGTLQGLVNAVNASGKGLRATPVNLGDGTYRLRIESATTGAASSFEVTSFNGDPLLGGATAAVTGRDATIQVGTDTIRSATNTFTDLMPGVSVTLAADAATNTAVDISLATDSAKMVASVKEMITALNGVLSDLDAATRSGGAGTTAGPLAGDSTLRSVRDRLLASVYPTSGGSLASVGVQLDKFGKVTFDEAAFKKAYEADPVTTAGQFVKGATSSGFADRLAVVATAASDKRDGLLTSSINGRKTSIDRLNDSIDSWDRKLELRQTTLSRQFTALETALSQMNSQSSWLAGQISSLPTSS